MGLRGCNLHLSGYHNRRQQFGGHQRPCARRFIVAIEQERSLGLCCPSVGKLQKAMDEDGFHWSRSSIFAAMGRLELTGILGRTRRHKRAWVTISGLLRQTTIQRSNLYTFSRPNAAAHLVPRPQKVLPAGERVRSFLRNLGRGMAFPGAEVQAAHGTARKPLLLLYRSGRHRPR